jgi:hypothetical protein
MLEMYNSFLFAESTVAGVAYLDMLTEWLLPQLLQDRNDFILHNNADATLLQ